VHERKKYLKDWTSSDGHVVPLDKKNPKKILNLQTTDVSVQSALVQAGKKPFGQSLSAISSNKEGNICVSIFKINQEVY
jgi:hypothetical protein